MKVGEIWAPTPARIKASSGWMSIHSNRAKQTKENSYWREPEGNVRILELTDTWNALPNVKNFVVFEYVDPEKDGQSRLTTPRAQFLKDYTKVYE